jgi:iron complex transport system permease protein
VDTERSKRLVFLAASLLTGAAVAFAGVIGFVGLLVPHAARAVAWQRSAGAAARLRSLRRGAARGRGCAGATAFAPAELPIGAVTAAIGAPLFAWLLLRSG